MQINYLADAVKDIYTDNPLAPTQLLMEVEGMLRQQQAEISVSENLVKHLHSENKQLRNENEELQAENQFFKDVMGDVEILRKAQEK